MLWHAERPPLWKIMLRKIKIKNFSEIKFCVLITINIICIDSISISGKSLSICRCMIALLNVPSLFLLLSSLKIIVCHKKQTTLKNFHHQHHPSPHVVIEREISTQTVLHFIILQFNIQLSIFIFIFRTATWGSQ